MFTYYSLEEKNFLEDNDAIEKGDLTFINVNVAGFEKKNINVSYSETLIYIDANETDPIFGEKSLHTTLEIPKDKDFLDCTLKNGMLTIVLKLKQEKKQKVKIN